MSNDEMFAAADEESEAHYNQYLPMVNLLIRRLPNLDSIELEDTQNAPDYLIKALDHVPLRKLKLRTFVPSRRFKTTAWNLEVLDFLGEIPSEYDYSFTSFPDHLRTIMEQNSSSLRKLRVRVSMAGLGEPQPPPGWLHTFLFPWSQLRQLFLNGLSLSADDIDVVLPSDTRVTHLSWFKSFREPSGLGEWLGRRSQIHSLTHLILRDPSKFTHLPFLLANPQLELIALMQPYPIQYILEEMLPGLSERHANLHTLHIEFERPPPITTSLRPFTLLGRSLRRLSIQADEKLVFDGDWLISHQKVKNELRELPLLTDLVLGNERPSIFAEKVHKTKTRAVVRMFGRCWPRLSFVYVGQLPWFVERRLANNTEVITPIALGNTPQCHKYRTFLTEVWDMDSES